MEEERLRDRGLRDGGWGATQAVAEVQSPWSEAAMAVPPPALRSSAGSRCMSAGSPRSRVRACLGQQHGALGPGGQEGEGEVAAGQEDRSGPPAARARRPASPVGTRRHTFPLRACYDAGAVPQLSENLGI